MQAIAAPIMLAAVFTVAAATAGAPANPQAAACPPAVQTEQRAAAPPPPDWVATTDGDVSHALSGITFFAGPPAQRASLIGDERAAGKGRQVATWPLAASETYWVACSYARTSVVLQRELPQGLKSCSVTYATHVRIGGLPQILKIECR